MYLSAILKILTMIYSGFSILDGDNLFVSNLSNRIDLYSLCTMQQLWHYESLVTINIPFQIALAQQALDCVVLGDVRGRLQVYDHVTGKLVHCLEHKTKGCIQIIDVSLLQIVYTLLTKTSLGWEYTQGRVYCCCVICSGSEWSDSTLVSERVPSHPSG